MITIKDINEMDRPYEKCLKNGPESLTDSELLAIIIRSGTREKNSIELARCILEFCSRGNEMNDGILGILHVSIEQLMSIKGVGKVKAVQLKCIAELSRRIHKSSYSEKKEFTSPEIIAGYFMEDLRHLEEEHLFLIFLNTKHKYLGIHELSKGTVNSSVFSPREAFIEALRIGAVSIILMHNHPSGDPSPSREDILTTRRMIEAGKILGILVLDHIIIGDNDFVSLKKQGII